MLRIKWSNDSLRAKMNREERLRRDCETAEQRDERLRRQRENARRRCAQLTEQQREEILQRRRQN